jgi:membrane protein
MAKAPERARNAYTAAYQRGTAYWDRGALWVDRQDPSSRKGATIGSFRRFRAADGQLYAVLLTAYLFITLLPALLVMVGYVSQDPAGLADRATRRLGLTGETATLVHGVLSGASTNKLGSTLIAVASIVVFGLGYGRVLQLVHARSWGIELPPRWLTDQMRYLSTLLALLVIPLLYSIQTKLLDGSPAWIAWVLAPVWLVVLLGYFVWMPRELLHRRVSVRAVLPGAVFTTLTLIGLRIVSSFLLVRWLVWYGQYYGGLGIVMALFFWLMIGATILVIAAAISPALAERRDLLEARRA